MSPSCHELIGAEDKCQGQRGELATGFSHRHLFGFHFPLTQDKLEIEHRALSQSHNYQQTILQTRGQLDRVNLPLTTGSARTQLTSYTKKNCKRPTEQADTTSDKNRLSNTVTAVRGGRSGGLVQSLGSNPPEHDRTGICPTGRTIMLRMTSKKVKDVVDKIRPAVVVGLSRSF